MDALLAMSAEDFSEFKELIVSLPTGGQFADVTQESLQTLKDTAGKVEAGRLAEIDAELNNISTRLAVISGMKPQLEEALKKGAGRVCPAGKRQNDGCERDDEGRDHSSKHRGPAGAGPPAA